MSDSPDFRKTETVAGMVADDSYPPSKEIKNVINDEKVDEALAMFNEVEQNGEVFNAVDDRKLCWKIDTYLLPLICITYMLQSIDKSTLGYAAVFNLQTDAHLVGAQYSWLSSLFYVGYFAWEYPTNLLLQRLPVGKFMAGTVITWGCVLMCHAACNNFSSLAAVRTFLGVFEASINPGTMLIFTMWYKRSEQPLRMGIWIGLGGVSYVLAGITSFGIGHIVGALASWKIVFLIWGAVTASWGVVLMIFLPDNPLTARFLTADEKRGVVNRIKENGTGMENRHFKISQFIEAVKDPKTWLLFLFALTSNSPNGGLTTFQGLIIKGMGFSTLRTTLIQMPSGAVQFVACVGATTIASLFPNMRLTMMLTCLVPFLAGIIGLWLINESNPYGRLACLWICFTYTATWTLSMVVAMANTAGHTKKITTNAFLLMGYCLGNFVGPFFFVTNQAPIYNLGVGMMFFCVGVQVLCIIGIWVLLVWRNRQRRAGWVGNEAKAYENGFLDLTDLENDQFKYVY